MRLDDRVVVVGKSALPEKPINGHCEYSTRMRMYEVCGRKIGHGSFRVDTRTVSLTSVMYDEIGEGLVSNSLEIHLGPSLVSP